MANEITISSEDAKRIKHQAALRRRVRKACTQLAQKIDADALYKRQVEDIEDVFDGGLYDLYDLIIPRYSFYRLYTIYEESDMLQECVDAMCENIDGFGYQLQFLGNDTTDRVLENAKAQQEKAENFFDYANDTESWVTIRKAMRKDLEIIGNGAFEIIRNNKGEMVLVYHIPFKTLRVTRIKKTDTPIKVSVPIKRNGEIINITIQKYFRKFAQIKSTGEKVRWFKSYGDPRIMDAATGDFVSDEKGNLLPGKKYPAMVASEIIHFKNNVGGEAYGLPRWLGVILDVIGRRYAQYVNYDLFENQGIPPMAVLVSGGTLTDESVEELEAMVRGMRGAGEWNKVALLESNLESTGLEEKGTAKIELKNLTEYRKDDQMFERYLKNTEETIRHSFRLPPLYTGSAESFCMSEDTETLTENGWKRYYEIDKNEKIATVNPETGNLEYCTPTGPYIFDHDGDMYHFKNTAIDCLVTPNHKMYISLRKNSEWKKVEAKDIFQTDNINYRVNFKVSAGHKAATNDVNILIPYIKRRTDYIDHYREIDVQTLFLLIGLYIGDGHASIRNSHYSIVLSAKKLRKIKIFREIGDKLSKIEGIKVSECKKNTGHTNIIISDRGLITWIMQNCGNRAENKHLPNFFARYSTSDLEVLLSGLIATDGNMSGHRQRPEGLSLPQACRYVTTSPRLAEQVQLLGFICGYQSVIPDYYYDIRPNRNPVYYVNLKKTDSINVHNFQHEVIPYKGKVYCFEVPNHLFVTRRNGKIGIHGNTHATAISARLAAEEQVFTPERQSTDEFINMHIVKGELKINLWGYKTKGPKIVGADALSKGVETFSKAGAFTINHAIDMANEAFGLQMSKFSEKWADYPINIVTKLLEYGRLGNLEAITDETVTVPPPQTPPTPKVAQTNLEKMDKATEKILDSDIFSEEEKALYKQLRTIQHAILSKEAVND